MRESSDAEYLELFLSGVYETFYDEPENHSHNFYIIERPEGLDYFFGRGYLIIEYFIDVKFGDDGFPIPIRFLMGVQGGVIAVPDKTWKQLLAGEVTRPIFRTDVLWGWE